MILFIEIIIFCCAGVFLFYLALLSFFAVFAQSTEVLKAGRFRKIAIVIPAHNEELSIEKTINSVLAIDYPHDKFDVVVAVDNCQDRTSELSKNLGAIVYERKNEILKGKGYALRWCFDLLSNEGSYEAVAVIDADTIVSKNFLNVMNNYIDRGSKAMQSCDLVVPQPDAWSSEITRLGFTLYNHVRPLGRKVIGLPCGLRGNGMCFVMETLKSVPWEAYSLAEDCEYGIELLLKEIDVTFVPEATVYATMPIDVRNAETQRSRWERGRFPIVRRHAGKLLKVGVKKPSYKAIDALIDLVTPPFVNLFLVVVALFIVSCIQWIVKIENSVHLIFLSIVLAGLGIFHVIVGLYAVKADRLLYKSLLYIPRYSIWKMLFYVKLVLKNSSNEWIRTTREQSTI
jgi:cellulose synthase/poly-beta-1,6-N-acetylglucosamine synthase-like glycosyltransferase